LGFRSRASVVFLLLVPGEIGFLLGAAWGVDFSSIADEAVEMFKLLRWEK
jgi:hypothetical protein